MRNDIARKTARSMVRNVEAYASLTVAATRRIAVEDGLPAELVEAIETELIESGRAARSFALESLTDAEIVADIYAADHKLTHRDVELSDEARRDVAFELRTLRAEDRIRGARASV